MSIFHRIVSISLLTVSAISAAGPALAQSSLPVISAKTQAHYVEECKKFITQELYEPALFSCYNAYQLGSTDMGAVLYRLGKYRFFDDATSYNLMQEYKAHQGSPEIKRLLLSIKFSSQSNYIAQGSIYGSWCFDQDMNLEAESSENVGGSYERLVISPTGKYLQASANIHNGDFTYNQNILSLGHPSFSDYQVKIISKNEIALKSESMKTAQIYSRKSCRKSGMQRFVQALVNSKSATNCDDISNYFGRQLIPMQYLPPAILDKLKQGPQQYNCPQLIQKISEA